MRVKEPSARRIEAALSVLAYFAVMYEATDEPRALAYAQAIVQLEKETIRRAQEAARRVINLDTAVSTLNSLTIHQGA